MMARTAKEPFGTGVKYGGALVLVSLVQLLITDKLLLFGVRPMLLPLCVAAGAVLEGSTFGAGFGFGAGLLSVLSFPGIDPVFLLLFPLVGFLSGLAGEDKTGSGWFCFFFCALFSLLCIEGLHVLPRLMGGASLFPLLSVALGELLYSMVFCFPIYALFRRVGKKPRNPPSSFRVSV